MVNLTVAVVFANRHPAGAGGGVREVLTLDRRLHQVEADTRIIQDGGNQNRLLKFFLADWLQNVSPHIFDLEARTTSRISATLGKYVQFFLTTLHAAENSSIETFSLARSSKYSLERKSKIFPSLLHSGNLMFQEQIAA